MQKLFPFFLSVFFLIACNKETIEPDDFWEVVSPESQGLDADSIEKAVDRAASLNNFYALLVVKNQKLVVEEYFKGKKSSDLFHLRSVTKNVTSALAGIAFGDQLLDGLEQSIQPFFPDQVQGDKSAITLGHLLNMTSGFQWDEDVEVLDLIEHRIADPVDNVLSRSLTSTPGSTFNYNSASPHIVSYIIRQQANQSFLDYAKKELFDPLGIEQFAWTKDPQGAVWAGFGLQLRARDLARFGQLYLNNGAWQGKQIVPESWVEMSANAQVDIPGAGSDYSLQWWISGSLDTPLYFGLGYGGQVLMLLPEKNMMVIALQESLVSLEDNQAQWNRFASEVFPTIYRSLE